ncbi:MAG: type II toxin-antitoxin system Phd/YefM family antitoxin [Propionibacteriaceae bacterium]|nr:type II toxin-antitoxin system Phd/YefM family antitoxin [Propionibacteriaceae bacterium]
MTVIPLADARANLSRLIDEAVRTHQRIEITRNGVRAAVVLSADDYDSLMETLDILADADLVAELHQAQLESNAGEVFTLEEVMTDLPAERRPASDPGSSR